MNNTPRYLEHPLYFLLFPTIFHFPLFPTILSLLLTIINKYKNYKLFINTRINFTNIFLSFFTIHRAQFLIFLNCFKLSNQYITTMTTIITINNSVIYKNNLWIYNFCKIKYVKTREKMN